MAGESEVGHLKQQVQAEVDRLAPDLFAVSRFLHANPELAYEERQAAELLTDVLEQHGFAVTRGVANPQPRSPAWRVPVGRGSRSWRSMMRSPAWGMPAATT